ncbi:hypothetical protein F4809DRAFT_343297 [Biscogniauxia mediterranea]|nr:hypothetical protein F4809DRAFT_343297 [Biscogniauxia mediterranea]
MQASGSIGTTPLTPLVDIKMSSYEARRLENIRRNQILVRELGLQNDPLSPSSSLSAERKDAAAKRRRKYTAQPTRASARIAKASSRPTAPQKGEDDQEDELALELDSPRKKPKPPSSHSTTAHTTTRQLKPRLPSLQQPEVMGLSVEALMERWSSWTPSAPPPTRDVEGNYHFVSHPTFTPNKSPEDIIREGSFGGSYWRPLYSRRLRTTVSDDWRELPASWLAGLSVERYLTSPTYDAAANKYGVACGQSIEAWEASGWIAHEHDVRGWFQWYCRFWLGRRCADDERQVERWNKCVGENGRWRRALLKKYAQAGIRDVADEDARDGAGGGGERTGLSPAIHQTCHHWAWEVRQEALDRFWNERR